MGVLQSMIWNTTTCECTKHIPLEALMVKPERRTPLDRFGFPQRCCWCCSLRVASAFICLVSFIWGGILIALADRTVAFAFPDRDAVFKYCKMVYIILCVVFLISCAGLMIGIWIRNEKFILVFIWYACIFNCLMMLWGLFSAVATTISKGNLGLRPVLRVMFSMIWGMIYFYLLMVVNSYKLAVWYLTLGFGY